MSGHERRGDGSPGRNGRRRGRGLAAAIGLAVIFLAPGTPTVRAQVVDCVLADVDHQVITLSDVRFAEAFGLVSLGRPAGPAPERRALLERMIDERVVIEFAQGEYSVSPDRIASALADLRASLPAGEMDSRLAAFGLRPEDLEPYLEEELLYREIIDQRFGRSVAVTLAEIEAYYDQTYVPARRKLGLEPEPLVRILPEIETAIRTAKTAAQVRTWIDSLRGQAEIVLKSDCLKILEEKRP